MRRHDVSLRVPADSFELDDLSEDVIAESSSGVGQECQPLIAAQEPRSSSSDSLLHPRHAGAGFTGHNGSLSHELTGEKLKRSRLARLTRKLSVAHEPGLTTKQLMLTNEDLKPVEPEMRLWGPWNFVAFWIADSFNINTWMISSSMVVNGLSWWQSWLCVWAGYAMAGAFICLTGRIGSTYHISFSVVSRASFGVWGAFWPVLNRALMACIWYGVQAWIGGNCVQLMIRAVFDSWNGESSNYKNTMHGSGTNFVSFCSFILFWVGSLPAIWFPVQKIRHLFTFKAFVVPVAALLFFLWILLRAKGVGPIIHQGNRIHGSELTWQIIKGVLSSIANFASLIVNDPDFARFAKKPRDALWSQLFTIPVGFAVTSFIGIMVSCASVVIWPEIGSPVWNPLDVLKLLLDEGGLGQRFGVFVIAAAFTLAQLGTNIAANSVSAGTDMTALLPRFLNIRRGGYICAFVGLLLCPWNFLSSTNKFLTYLSAYSVFLSSIAGVIVSDYYFVRKGYLRIRDLYSARESAPYYYTYGVHWRAYAAYILGILINVVGFAGAVGAEVPKIATYIYNLNYFCGFVVASSAYWLLCKLSPIEATSDVWLEIGDEICNPSLSYDEDDEDIEDSESGRVGLHRYRRDDTGKSVRR